VKLTTAHRSTRDMADRCAWSLQRRLCILANRHHIWVQIAVAVNIVFVLDDAGRHNGNVMRPVLQTRPVWRCASTSHGHGGAGPVA
jgi:hypothetical protein